MTAFFQKCVFEGQLCFACESVCACLRNALTNGIPHSLQEGKVGNVCISVLCVVSTSFGVTVHCVHFEKQVIDFLVTFSEKSFEKIRVLGKKTKLKLPL